MSPINNENDDLFRFGLEPSNLKRYNYRIIK